MNGDGNNFFARARERTKTPYHRAAPNASRPHQSSLFLPNTDDHYDNEQPSRRRRMNEPPPNPPRTHYPGDGYDYRRPIMSTGVAARAEPGAQSGSAANNSSEVIDLTDDSGIGQAQGANTQSTALAANSALAGSSRAERPPRFGRNVIDVEPDEEQHEEQQPGPGLFGGNARSHLQPGYRTQPAPGASLRPRARQSPPPDNDEVEFVSTRPRSRNGRESRHETPAHQNGVVDLTADDDEDYSHYGARRNGGVNADGPGATAGLGTRSVAEEAFTIGGMGYHFGDPLANLMRGSGRLLERLQTFVGRDTQADDVQRQDRLHRPQDNTHRHRHRHDGHGRGVRAHVEGGQHLHIFGRGTAAGPARAAPLMMPGMMDYDMTGFDLGLEGAEPPRPPTPKYVPPSAPAKGFTRSPAEDEEVVCPNCGDELAVGESEPKQEVWVIKNCGHAYCGACARNRTKSAKSSKKGKGKVSDAPPPFKKCVVEDCDTSASKAAMVRIYFGS